MAVADLRRQYFTRPILAAVGGAMPALSATESEAIDAGDTWLARIAGN